MKIAALLPHVEVFGGVRRYLEIGNELTRRGHSFVLFHPQGVRPGWLEFQGKVRPFSALAEESFDIGLCSEYAILRDFEKLRAKVKFFYFLLEGHKEEREVVKKGFILLGNSEGICRRIERKYGVPCIHAPGGVNPAIFYPLEPEKEEKGYKARSGPAEFQILCYGRIYKKRKGVRHVIRAVESLYRRHPQLRLIFFDTLVGEDRRDPRLMIKTRVPFDFHLNLPQDRMAWLFSQADVFVSAERRAGWANTAAEAMACRVPVVCTRRGTRDFAVHDRTALVVPVASACLLSRQIRKLIKDDALRRRLAQAGYEKIREFTWGALTAKVETIFREKLSSLS